MAFSILPLVQFLKSPVQNGLTFLGFLLSVFLIGWSLKTAKEVAVFYRKSSFDVKLSFVVLSSIAIVLACFHYPGLGALSVAPPFEPGKGYFKYDVPSIQVNFFEKSYLSIRDFIFYQMPHPFHLIFSTGFLPLSFLIYLLFSCKQSSVLALCAMMLLMRYLILDALTPTDCFKYVTSIWLGGWLLLLAKSSIHLTQSKKNLKI
ncbi:MAG: hypothetical protein H7256_06130 [Bdellovibrio sp.]|nr:hypothetical protein [Bdellovibrio sp.]